MFATGAQSDSEIESLLADDLASLNGDELGERLLALDALRSRVEHAFRLVLGEFDARAAFANDGAVHAGAWLAARADLSSVAARAEVKTARRVRQMPVVAEAAATGELGSAKVWLFARVAKRHEPAVVEAFARDEAMLVDHAKQLTVDQTAYLLRHWRACADDTTAESDAAQMRERRWLHVSETFGGMWVLDGRLDPESGAIVSRALEAIGDDIYRAERASADGAGDPSLRSTPAQRRADALVELARCGPIADPHNSRAPVPLMVATINVDSLEGRTGGPAELESGGTISATAARRLACDAGISRMITNGESAPLDLGRTTRTITGAQRRALAARDRGCVFPGCDRPPGWCDAHHITHWVNGGATNLDNLCLLCSHHHHLVHEGGFAMTRGPNGTLTFTRPNGMPIEVPFASRAA